MHSVSQSLKCLMFCGGVLGLYSVHVQEQTLTSFMLFKLWGLVIAVFSIQAIVPVYHLLDIFDEHPLTVRLYWFEQIIVRPTLACIILTSSLISTQVTCDFVNSFLQLGVLITTKCRRQLHGRLFTPVVLSIYFLGNIITLANFYEKVRVLESKLLEKVSLYTQIQSYYIWILFDVICWTCVHHIWFFGYSIHKMFILLNAELERVLRCSECSVHLLEELRGLHVSVVKLCSQFDEFFATRVIVILSSCVIALPFALFLIIFIQMNNWELDYSVYTFLTLFGLKIMTLGGLIYPFIRISNEFWKTNKILLRGLVSTSNHIEEKELEMYSQVLHYKPLEFSPHGMVGMNGSTVLSWLAASISYLIVLLQFQFMTKSGATSLQPPSQNDTNSD